MSWVLMTDPGFKYYLITDRKWRLHQPLQQVVDQACRYGIRAVQLREKDLPAKELYELAKELRKVTSKWNAKLFINDRADIALAAKADGVHCREGGIGPADVKKISSSLMVGASVHSVESAIRAEREGADFLLFGPVYYTPSKAVYGKPQGTGRLREVADAVQSSVFAVGGLKPEHVSSCLSAGAYGVAGISSIMGAEPIDRKIMEWKNVLNEL